MQLNNDSINWPPEFSELKRLDVILKCGICYDFMNNCMITSCSHTYCSLCIRRFMQYKNQCPICYEETYEINLRNNRLLDEVIHIYTKIRDKLLRASRLASVNIPPKYEPKERKTETKDLPFANAAPLNKSNEDEENDKEITASDRPTDLEENKASKLPASEDDAVFVNGVKIPVMFTSPKISCTRLRRPEELADCPVCQVQVPARNINIHLDSCLALDPSVRPRPKPRRRSPLPKRVYAMMPEKNIRRYLKEYGLSTIGDRKAMIARLQRYTVIYNAENDAVNPRTVSELIKQLEREEREEKKPNTIMKNKPATAPRPAVPKNDLKAIEKANRDYCEENKASFKKLIEEMRAREGRNIKPLKPPSRIYSDDEDVPNKVITVDNIDLPTTSGCNLAKQTQATMSDENMMTKDSLQHVVDISTDSDEDIFIASDTEEISKNGKIDWNKTAISVTEETPESIYDIITQNPSSEFDDLAKEEIENTGLEKDKVIDIVSKDETKDSLTTEYTDSDNSVFDYTNVKKNYNSTKAIEDTPKNRTSKGIRRRLSLSCKKKGNKRKRKVEEESINEIGDDSNIQDNFANNSDNEQAEENNVTFNGIDEDGKSNEEELNNGETRDDNDAAGLEDEILDDDVANDESINNHTGECEKILENSPMKRLTRSAKRKSISSQEVKLDELNTTPVTRKKSKRDLSPAFD